MKDDQEHFNNHPNLPMITGKVTRIHKGKIDNTVVDTLATAAVAIIKALKDPPPLLHRLTKECAHHTAKNDVCS